MEGVTNNRAKNNSLRTSILIHLMVFLIAWVVPFNKDPDKTIDTQYAVTVSFQEIEFKSSKSSNSTKSEAAEGKQRPKETEVKKVEKATPIKVAVPKPTPPKPTPKPTEAPKPEPTDPVFSETTVDESEIQAIEEEDIVVDDPEPEYIPESMPDPEPEQEEVIVSNPDLPSIEDILDDIEVEDDPSETTAIDIPAEESGSSSSESPTEGSGDNDPSLADGEEGGTGKGDTGSGKGSDDSGDDNDSGIGTGDHGKGEFDASGDGIFGRKVLYRDPKMISYVSGKTGKVVFKVCIGRSGKVTFLQVDELLTTIKDNSVLRKALDAMSNYKYEPDLTAPKEQCGEFTVSVDNFQGIR